jgi:hypothetical protein
MTQQFRDSTLRIGDAVIPLRAALGYSESWKMIGQRSLRHTFTGVAKRIQATFKPKWEVTISASGPHVWRMPDMEVLLQDAPVLIDLAKWWTAKLPAGSRTGRLLRHAVPGQIRVEDPATGRQYPLVADGLDIEIESTAARDLSILYKPRMSALITTVEMDANTGDATGGYSFTAGEERAPT